MVNSRHPEPNRISALIDDFKAGVTVRTLASHYHLTPSGVYYFLSRLCPQEHRARMEAKKRERQKRLELLTAQKEVQRAVQQEIKERFYQSTIAPLIKDYKSGVNVRTLAAQYHLTPNRVYHYLKKWCPEEYQARLDAKNQEKQRHLKRLTSGYDRIIPVL